MTHEIFETHRSRLMGIAYRLLGIRSEAEDVVQDVFVKWIEHNAGKGVNNPDAWLAKVCTNRCLDILKSAHHKRMSYVGPWLPEPLQTETVGSAEDAAALACTLGTAFLMMLDRLSPKERAAYLLREVFDYDYDAAAEILGIGTANCRQLVSRARRHVGIDARRNDTSTAQKSALLDAFRNAVETGETANFAQLLGKSVELHADGGGKVIAAQRVIEGDGAVELFVRRDLFRAWQGLAIAGSQINSEPGLILMRGREVFGCVTCAVGPNGQAAGIFIMRNPDKLQQLTLPVQADLSGGTLRTDPESNFQN